MKTTYYVEPHDPIANRKIALLLSQHACESETADRKCADKLSRNLWVVPDNLLSFILSSSDLNVTIFKDEGLGIVLFGANDFVAISSSVAFDDPTARKNFMRRISSNNQWMDLLRQLEKFARPFVTKSLRRKAAKTSKHIRRKLRKTKNKKK